MNPNKLIPLAVVALLVVVALAASAYIVTETEQVFITQFGKPVGTPITEPGLHFKVPFIQKLRSFDKRFLAWDGDPNQVPTKDKLFISIDTYARWRIADPLLFFQKVRTDLGAQTRLNDILDGETRTAVAKHNLVDIIRSRERSPSPEVGLGDADALNVLPAFEIGRSNISDQIISQARPVLAELGIELLDLRFKRINYSAEVQQAIYQRMISERNRIAEKYRSEGMGEAEKIRGQQERDLKTISSQAYRQVQEIRGEGDAEATRVYAAAYNQSSEAQSFYEFQRTLELYDTTVTNRDWLILSTDSEFYGYLKTHRR
jgi:membrane protease subunit HflC